MFQGTGLFLRASVYYAFLADWLSVFPRDQVLIVHAETYYANRTRGVEEVFDFLGFNLKDLSQQKLNQISESKVANAKSQHSERSTAPMQNDTRKFLGEFYRPYNKKLAELLSDKRFMWEE